MAMAWTYTNAQIEMCTFGKSSISIVICLIQKSKSDFRFTNPSCSIFVWTDRKSEFVKLLMLMQCYIFPRKANLDLFHLSHSINLTDICMWLCVVHLLQIFTYSPHYFQLAWDFISTHIIQSQNRYASVLFRKFVGIALTW